MEAIIVIPNERLLQLAGKGTSFKDAFAMCDDVLRQAVEGISDLITTPGIINVDFADIKSIMSDAGSALMGIGTASGEDRARVAATQAINSPLLELSINGAEGVLFAISGGDDLGIGEVQEAAQIITESVDPNAKIIFGTIRDERLGKGEIKVTVIATGFLSPGQTKQTPAPVAAVKEVEIKKEPEVLIDGAITEKKEINNSLPSDYIKPKEKKTETIILDDLDDDTDDWSAVPAFLRRSKK